MTQTGNHQLAIVINEYLDRTGSSQRELAEAIGVNHRTISQWSSGHAITITPTNIIRLAQVIGEDPFVLLAMIYPELADGIERIMRLDMNTLALAQQITQLGDKDRALIDFVIGQRKQQQR